jgi:S1-C subfamily serine protease
MSEPFAQYPYGQHGQYGQYTPPEPPRRHRSRTLLGLTATAIVAAGVGAGAAVGLSGGSSSSSATSTSSSALSATQIATKTDPAIVDVISTLGDEDATAEGTGIVLTSNGEILTNNHVIDGATSIQVVTVSNDKKYTATVVGYNATKDIAVLQLKGASGLTVASTGDSSSVAVGDSVTALGNAGGKGGTPSVAAGSIVATNQSITASDDSSATSENLTGMFETNADIQAGDSGGPLVNSKGQIIGIDTAASTSYSLGGSGEGGSGGFGSGGYGYGGSGSSGSSGSSSSGSSSDSTTQGYAIPINTALSIAKEIEAGDASSTVHIGATAFIGVELSSTGSSSGLGGSTTSGVAIAGAKAGTPAATAGLADGDTITSLDGKPVTSESDITSILVGLHPGDKVSIGWTDAEGSSQSASITLATGPAD